MADHPTLQFKNEAVIWDRIIRRKEEANVNVIGKNKYNLRDLSTTFKYVSSSLLPETMLTARFT